MTAEDTPTYVASHPMRGLVAFLFAVTLTAFASILAAPSTRQHKTGVAPGVVADITWDISHADIDRTVSMMRAAGVKWVRADANWKLAQQDGPGAYDWSVFDYAINKARGAGLSILMGESGVPYWASGDPKKYIDAAGTKHWYEYYRPANYQNYIAWLSAMASHYQGLGVHYFQIWNEPNIGEFFPSGVNATEYVQQMLMPGYQAIKQADPKAQVVMAGLSLNDYRYLEQMYAAGAKGYFDIAATHPYTVGNALAPETVYYNADGRMDKMSFPAYREVEKVLQANGDARKPYWFSEFGWATCSSVRCVNEATQADYLRRAYKFMQQDSYIEVAFWYNFRNNFWAANADTWDDGLGLLRMDFSAKPSYQAYQSYWVGGNTTVTDRVPLYRLRWGSGGADTDHFYTNDQQEWNFRSDLMAGFGGYTREGPQGSVMLTPQNDRLPLYRLWNPTIHDHLYTTSSSERDLAIAKGWTVNEGTTGYVYRYSGGCAGGTTPLYRLYSSGATDHLYTVNKAEADSVVSTGGYVFEGVIGCIIPN